ncbi:MAG: tetratricopeptide repeat protein [bacterium]
MIPRVPLRTLIAVTWILAGCGDGAERAANRTPTEEPPAYPTEDTEPQVVSALAAARAAVVSSPGAADAWGRYGILLDAHDLYGPAATCYRAAHGLAPDAFDWLYLLARVEELGGAEPDVYLPELEQALAIRPEYAPGEVRLGEALLRAGRAAEAAAHFRRATELDPGLAAAFRGLGRALLGTEDVEGARAALERSVALQPDDGAAWGFLAQVLVRAGARDEARAAQTKSRELEPKHVYWDPVLARIGDAGLSADQCLRRGRERLAAGNAAAAVPDLEIAKTVRPDDAQVAALLAGALARSGRPAEAREEYRRALGLREDYPEAHRDLAALLVRTGEFLPAAEHYRRAEELEGADSALVAARAAALAQGGDPAAAVKEFARAETLGSLDARALSNWGTAWAQLGRPDQAAPLFERAVERDPGSANAWANLGAAREDLGDVGGARDAYRRAVGVDPRHRAAGRLRALGG